MVHMERGFKPTLQNTNDEDTKTTLDNIAEEEEKIKDHPNVKLVEARTAILLLKNRAISARTEPTMWILENMFRPLTTRDYNDYQLLLLSAAVKPAWERKRKQPQPQAQQSQATATEGGHFTSQVISPSTNEGTPTPPVISHVPGSQDTVYNHSRVYVLTPRTRILTVAKEHSMVFMVDLSSSLATIETSTGKVMIGTVFHVLENIIHGLVKPFSLNTSDNSPPIVMEYIIRITVIAECSQFGSNMNVIPILAEYPTIRVLMQNVHVSVNNVTAVLSNLKSLIDEFKKDLGKFRKKLTTKRLKMGYELDVREDRAQSVAESAESNFISALESPTKFSAQPRKGSVSTGNSYTTTTITTTIKSMSLPRHSRNKSITSSKQHHGKKSDTTSINTNYSKKSANNHHHHRHNSHHHRYNSSNTSNMSHNVAGPTRQLITKDKKDVWGVGKTGSSLSYVLRAGLFALNLLPKNGVSSLTLLTDGVVKSNIQDGSVIRQLTAENIACNVIQIGQDKSFFPGLNFGFVPDVEVLEFLTNATHGVFTYAENCPPLPSEESTTDIFSLPPNIYHHRYMLKEIHLDHFSRRKIREAAAQKSKSAVENDGSSASERTSSSSNSSNAMGGASAILGIPHVGRRAFPWDPISKPIVDDVVRLKFKEYFLPIECWHFMRARLRQGFVLHSISFADEPKLMGSTKSTTLNKTADDLPNFQTKQNVLIVFILRWQPNITVQYTIKALWTSSLRYYLKTIAQERMIHIPEDPQDVDINDSMFNCMRAPKAEIIIKSTSTFSHMLHNWDNIQRRNQMMAVQGGNATIDFMGAPGFIKVGKMKRFLERLAEADSLLKQLVQFNMSDKSHITVQQQFDSDTSSNNAEWLAQLNYIQKFSSHWTKLEKSDLRFFNTCWYDENFFNLILVGNRASPMDYQQDQPQQRQQIILMSNNDASVIQIHGKLEQWSTFMSEDHQVYIKLLNIDETMHTLKTAQSPNGNSKRLTSNALQHTNTRKHVVLQFCEVRVIRETDCVLCIKLMFFNADADQRQYITDELQNLFSLSHQNLLVQTLTGLEVKNVPSASVGMHDIEENEYNLQFINLPVKVTKRPLSSLLIRDDSHFLPASHIKGSDLELEKYNATCDTSMTPWYINPALILTGEYIVRNYLYQYTWHWDAQDVPNDKQLYGRYFVPVLDLAFDHITVIRLDQEWNLISANKCFAHFYKEVSYVNSDSVECTYSIQYFIWKDIQKKKISTEVWLEPLSDENTLKRYDVVKAEIFERDKQILSQLITFDIVHHFGQNFSISDIAEVLKDQMEIEDEVRGTVKWMQRTSVFNLSSVLRLGSFLFALYPCPNYSRHFHPDNSNDSAIIDHQPLQLIQQEMSQAQPEQQQSSMMGEIIDTSTSHSRRRNNTGTINAVGTRSRTVSKFSPIGSPLSSSRTPLIWQADKSTTCTCPRPDELFCIEKDDISKLRPVLRDIALLHYYVEQSLSAVTDRSMSLNKTPNDEFWSLIVKELFMHQDIGANKSTLFVAQNFRDMRCFIKIFDPSVFVIILIPRLDSVVKGLCKLDNSNTIKGDDRSFDRMGLMMFECQRQDSPDSYTNTLTFDQIKVLPIDPLSSKEWLESLRSTLRPQLARGYFSSSLANEKLSDRTLRLTQDVTQVYSRSFVKSIFTCLLHGRAIDSEDFEKVLEICDESNLDIDLTGYLNVQTLLKRSSRTNEEELISTNQRFISVLGHYFEPVIISNTKWTNMYCYRPSFAKVGQKLGLSLSSGEKPSNLADVVVCAQNPLFVRLDCTLRKPSKSGVGFEELTLPLRSLPVLYQGELEDGTDFNFEPECIGSKFSPVDSADGTTATLHLVCMTLPQSEYDPPNALFSHKPSCPADSPVYHQPSFLDAEKTHRARLASLSQDKQDALVETEARLTWLFTEEIMHGLLRSSPITQNVIRYIEAQLKKKNPFVDFPTTTFIPLAFVKNQKDSRRMFFEELEKHNSTLYRLIRVGDCFYASDNSTSSSFVQIQPDDTLNEDVENGSSIFDGEGLNITTHHQDDNKRIILGDDDSESDASEDSEEEGSNDEFCQGLGISILETETPDEEDGAATVRHQEPVRPQLYWLLLIPQAHSVQIYFYSKMQQSVNRSEIIRETKSMVNDVMERTNKMSLLQYLNDTRRCSKYLFASVEDEKHMYSSCEESSEEDDVLNRGGNGNNLVEILSTSGEEPTFAPPKKFLPGQFNCKIVYTKRFALHWRLAPNTAYNKLMTVTLRPFLVKNMPGMFVCSHQNAVVYCFLSEVVTTIHHSSTLSDGINQSLLSAANNLDDSYYGANPESPYGSSVATSGNEPEVLGTSHSRIRHHSHVYNKPSPQGSVGSDRQQFSPRQSPNLIDAGGASASSPVTGIRKQPGTRHYEGRELVLEVYGVEVDDYLIDGLVEMIDSRITSEITLKEVQQFLVRNPNSKLSRADIDFILPVDKDPLIRQQLVIPPLIENTVQFLKIFRKNVLTGSSLHPIHSNYLPGLVKRHHDMRYSNYDYMLNGSRVLEEQGQRMPTEDWSCLDFAFYYSYVSRAPGMCSPLEQKIGEGVAGICLSVLNEDDLAYNRIISNYPSPNGEHGKFDIETLKTCLTSDLDHVDCNAKLKVAIDIWSHCKIDTNQIYQYFYKSFRQSICDYIIENTVSCMASTKQDHQNFKSLAKLLLLVLNKAAEWESSTVKQVSRQIQLAPWYFDGIILQLKSDLTDIHLSLEPFVARAALSSTLSNLGDNLAKQFDDSIEYEVYIPGSNSSEPGESDLGLQYINEDKGTRSLPSLVSHRDPFKSNRVPEHHQAQAYHQNKTKLMEIEPSSNVNYRYLVISGLPELYSKYIPSSTPSIRRCSTETSDQGNNRSNNPRNMYFASSGSAISPIGEENHQQTGHSLRREDTASLHSRQESLASSLSKALPGYMSKQKGNDPKEMSHQHSFALLMLDSFQASIYAYNCSDQFTDHLYNTVFKNIIQQETRHMGLSNILHQKLGLFHHSETMVNILSRNQEPDASAIISPMTVPATPLQHNALNQVQMANNSNNRTVKSPSLVNTIGRLVQIDSSSSIPSIESVVNERKTKMGTVVADFENLQQLVKNTFDYKHRSLRQKSLALSVLDIHENVKLCKTTASKSNPSGSTDVVFTAVRGADANTVLRDMYADSTENNKNWYSKDYLLRHGEPYLDMYLARSKPLAAHEKAFKVYTKWADHYYGPGHTKTTDEMMTVDELKQILKASRLLHFCRTPLIFSESSTATTNNTHPEFASASLLVNGSGFKKLFNKPTVSKSAEITEWYEKLSSGFMREYASYLESIGMHLIVYGPSNDQQDEIEAYLSRFTIAEDYSVDSPVVYLLQVFEGGSIMCEVRLTNAFVSVTLYTLHRRYGRLQHSPYSHQQRKKIGRQNFQKFMGECDQFKQRIHVNSFVFDFHLRYIQRSLDDMDSLPPNLNLLSIIKNTVSVYDRPAIYSRNRIIHGTYEFGVDDSSKELISWIMNTGQKLGLKTLKVDKVPVACFVSSDDLYFDNGMSGDDPAVDSENTPFRYTLIICPTEKLTNDRRRETVSVHRQGSFDMIGSNSAQKLVSCVIGKPGSKEYRNYSTSSISLQYFVLVTYRSMDRCYTSDRCQRAWSEVLKDKPKRYANFLDEVLSPEKFKLSDVFQSAKCKMDNIAEKALHFYHREADWNTIYEIVGPNPSKESPEYLIQLASRFCPIDLSQADSAFDKFLQLNGINWHDCLDNIRTFYRMTSGEIYIRDTRHVLLFIPNAGTPAFFHFVYTPGEKCVVSMSSKEDRKETQVLTEEEKYHISHLATSLSYYIWTRIQYY